MAPNLPMHQLAGLQGRSMDKYCGGHPHCRHTESGQFVLPGGWCSAFHWLIIGRVDATRVRKGAFSWLLAAAKCQLAAGGALCLTTPPGWAHPKNNVESQNMDRPTYIYWIQNLVCYQAAAKP